jgi:nucleotide-binding universal stress UspA family protein
VVVRDWLPNEMLDEVVLGVEPDQEPAPIRYAFDAAARYSATLHAVRVWHPQTLYSSMPGGDCDDLTQIKRQQASAVEMELEQQAAAHPEVKVEISTGRGNTVPVLAEAARGTKLLVVGADRHRGPLSVGAGYVVDGLLAHAATPVAVVPIG